jgi:tetratricopeptide (TPR) repeat protein
MAFRPEDRYATAKELAGEVARWLADEPVAAYRDGWLAKAGRWARRRRTLVASLAVLLVSAVVALSASTALVVGEQRRTPAEKEHADAQKVLAEEAAERSDASCRITRGLTGELVNIVEARLSQIARTEQARSAIVDAVLPAFRRFLEQRPDDAELMGWYARLSRMSANLRRLLGDITEAETRYAEAIRLEEALVGMRPDDPGPRDRLAQTWRDYAALRKMTGRLSEARAYLSRSVEVAEGLLAGQGDRAAYRRTLAISFLERSEVQYLLGRPDESLHSAERAAELFRGLAVVLEKEADPLDPLLLAMALNRVGAARVRPDQRSAGGARRSGATAAGDAEARRQPQLPPLPGAHAARPGGGVAAEGGAG